MEVEPLAMTRREAVEANVREDAREVQPRRFEIVLRKPLAMRNPNVPANGGGAFKSAFKTPKLPTSDAVASSPGGTTRRVSFKSSMATGAVTFGDAMDIGTPTAKKERSKPPRVTHRRGMMRTRPGTGRRVAARTFSLVLKTVPTSMRKEGEIYADPAPPPSAVTLRGSLDGSASGVAAGSGGSGASFDGAFGLTGGNANATQSGSVEQGGAFAEARRRGVSFGTEPEPPLNDVGPPGGFGGDEMDDGDFGGDGGGYDGDDWGERTPAAFNYHHHASGTLVDGYNDPMTVDGKGFFGRKRKFIGPRKPAGTPHKRERKEFSRRKSLVAAGSRHDLEHIDGRPIRRSTRQRCKPLEYWRGETKHYTRTHASLPTVEEVTTRTPNPYWPMKTPAENHRAGGGKRGRMDSAKAAEEARLRALQLANIAHLTDSEDDDGDDDDDVHANDRSLVVIDESMEREAEEEEAEAEEDVALLVEEEEEATAAAIDADAEAALDAEEMAIVPVDEDDADEDADAAAAPTEDVLMLEDAPAKEAAEEAPDEEDDEETAADDDEPSELDVTAEVVAAPATTPAPPASTGLRRSSRRAATGGSPPDAAAAVATTTTPAATPAPRSTTRRSARRANASPETAVEPAAVETETAEAPAAEEEGEETETETEKETEKETETEEEKEEEKEEKEEKEANEGEGEDEDDDEKESDAAEERLVEAEAAVEEAPVEAPEPPAPTVTTRRSTRRAVVGDDDVTEEIPKAPAAAEAEAEAEAEADENDAAAANASDVTVEVAAETRRSSRRKGNSAPSPPVEEEATTRRSSRRSKEDTP